MSDSGLLKASGSQVIPTLISRITGFLKVVALAATVGLGAAGSSFTVANTLPNIVAELVLGAVLTSIVVPVLVRAEREDPDGGVEFTRRLLTVAGLVLFIATVIAMVGAPQLIRLFIDADGQVDTKLATLFAFLLLPQILFYGLGALFGAILNTRGMFGKVAWAPVLNNVVTLAVIVVYFLVPGDLEVSLANPKLLVLGIGTTLGIVAQAAYLVPPLRELGVDLRPKWGIDARLKNFGGMGIAVLSYVLVSQVGFIITTRVASQYDQSGPVLFANAWLLLQVPYGVLGVSLITAIMPRMSRSAAADDTPAVVADLSLASRLSTVGLLPIVALFTVHGTTLGIALFSLRGTASAVDNAGRLGTTVAVSAFGLIPFAIGLIQLRVFYAKQQPWIPTYLMALTVAVRIPLMLWIPPGLHDDQVVGWLAFTNGVGFTVGAVAGQLLLRRQLGRLDTKALVRTLVTVLAASLIAVAMDALVGLALPLNSLERVFGVLAGSVAAMTVHTIIVLGIGYGLLVVFKLPEIAGIVDAVANRLPSRFTSAARRARKPLLGPNELAETELDPSMFEQTTLLPRIPAAAFPYPYPEMASRYNSRGGGGAVPGNTGPIRPSAPGPRPMVRGPRLVPGAAVAGGRYRLLVAHGGSGLLRFWQARDTVLERDVALTFVDADQTGPAQRQHGTTEPEGPQTVLTRTLHLGRIDSPGLARVLDVVRGSSGGIVVAEWTNGRSLKDVAATNPPPVGAARAVRALAGAAEAAHRYGAVLGLDHPDRIRISAEGNAVLAFPGVPAGTDRQADVQGLGAILYALITNSWPLAVPTGTPAGTAEGMPVAERRPDGSVTPARVLRAGVPFEISAVTERALQPESGIRTAAAVQTVLDQAAVLDQHTDFIPPYSESSVEDSSRTTELFDQSPLDYDVPSSDSAAAPQTDRFGTAPALQNSPKTARRSRKVLVAMGVLALAAVLVIAFIANQVVSALGGKDAPLPSLSVPGSSSATGSVTSATTAPPTQQGSGPVIPSRATVFSPDGTLDNVGDAGKAIDGNPVTFWATDRYRAQFPKFKSGVGLLVTFPDTAKLSSVGVDSPSDGTVVEIRSSSTANPTLADTRLLNTAQLKAGHTDITLSDVPPSKYVLVWVTRLSGSTGSFTSKINELTFQRAG
jgi:putative peptidoglycan lipid II flippase